MKNFTFILRIQIISISRIPENAAHGANYPATFPVESVILPLTV
ncbi:MAG TPA: hypothetical protein VGS10_00145 [Terracidiphilus sp.]|nr:hypothetical protein [Terracidiphilus sp.]